MAKTTGGFEFEVLLVGSEPAIFRRVRVPARFTLAQLHRVIQALFAWNDSHLHEFSLKGQRYAVPHEDDLDGLRPPPLDEAKYKLADLELKSGDVLEYLYDFGDGWEHQLKVEKLLGPAPLKALCLNGERSSPPDDCGGIFGYAELLEALADPSHERHEELTRWGGLPTAFNLKKVNAALARIR